MAVEAGGVAMRVLRGVRLTLGIVATLLITVAVSAVSMVFALLGQRRWANYGTPLWAWLTSHIAYPLVGIRYVVEDQVSATLDPGRPVLLLSNHPRSLEAVAQCDMLRQLFAPARMILGVMKRELMYTPLGIGLWAMGTVPIDRTAGQATIDRIAAWAKSLPDKAPAIILYPDGTRGSAARRQAMCEKLVKKTLEGGNDGNNSSSDSSSSSKKAALEEDVARIRRVCATTMPPMAGGCLTLLKALPGVQVVLVTSSNSHGLSSIPELVRNPAPTVRIHVKKVVTLPQETVALQRELMRLWDEEICPDLQVKERAQ